MKRRDIAIAAAALAATFSTAALAGSPSDWVAMKSPKELRALYSNTTFQGKGPDGSSFTGYYSADGRGLLISYGRRIARTWRVKGDEVCITDPRGTNCYRFRRNRMHHNEIVGRQVTDGWQILFTVKQGAPNF